MAFVDGSVVSGKTVVVLSSGPVVANPETAHERPEPAEAAAADGPVLSSVHEPSKAALAEAQAAALQSAAATGAPFCADCKQANDKLAAAERASR